MTTTFRLPPQAGPATPPAERDGVRLLVARAAGVEHRGFRDLPALLEPGDLLVVNTSATLPAALDAVRSDGRPVPVHVAGEADDGSWLVELRRPDRPDLTGRPGEVLRTSAGLRLTLLGVEQTQRIWRARPEPAVDRVGHLSAYGCPIAYRHLAHPLPLEELQNAYAGEPGSAEMASAGRPLTPRVLARLVTRGVAVAPVVLHAGVSSPEAHEPPLPERFEVPAETAGLVEHTRARGHRVVAVGTTVVRALESAVGPAGARGWTDLVLGPDRPAQVVTGLVSGLHEPEASHLLLLEAVAGPDLVQRAYDAAVREGYRWHELGDSMLLLP